MNRNAARKWISFSRDIRDTAREPSAPREPSALYLSKVRRYLRSPKGYLTVALLAMVLPAALSVGAAPALTVLGWAVAGSVAMELVLVWLGSGRLRFPSSALLTGLIIGMVLGPHEPWYAAAIAGVLAADAKHLLRVGRGHVFNPAAFGLMAVFVFFGTGQSWWGALAELHPLFIIPLLVAGYVVASRANKLPAALVFLGVYYALFTVTSFSGNTALMAELYRPPFVQAALYFGFFMVTDPPTSPVGFRGQIWFGALVAVAAYVVFMGTEAVYFLPVAILIGNAVYAVQRYAIAGHTRRSHPSGRMAEPSTTG